MVIQTQNHFASFMFAQTVFSFREIDLKSYDRFLHGNQLLFFNLKINRKILLKGNVTD